MLTVKHLLLTFTRINLYIWKTPIPPFLSGHLHGEENPHLQWRKHHLLVSINGLLHNLSQPGSA